jgi:hypothetical protein
MDYHAMKVTIFILFGDVLDTFHLFACIQFQYDYIHRSYHLINLTGI